MSTAAELYLVRHAIAAERGEEWPDDDLRPLTDRGRTRFAGVVSGLAALGVTLDEVFTSPLVRARQTADLLAVGATGQPPVTVLKALAPGEPPTRVLSQLGGARSRRRVALIGHEPGLGELAALLLGAAAPLPFKKGGVCRIDVSAMPPRGPGILIWFAPPRLLRLAGE